MGILALPRSPTFVIVVGIIPTAVIRLAMATAEKISIALPQEMVAVVRGAVATGEYSSSSEVIRDALRDWSHKRSQRQQKGIAAMRQLWQEALRDDSAGVPAKPVLDRLARKYKAIADAAK